jgi:hypothetical protein
MREEREVALVARIGPPAVGDAGERVVPLVAPVATLDGEPDVHQLSVVP